MNKSRFLFLLLVLGVSGALPSCGVLFAPRAETIVTSSVSETANAPESPTRLAPTRALESPTAGSNAAQSGAPTRVPLPSVLIPTPPVLKATPARAVSTQTPGVAPTAPRQQATPRSIADRIAALRNQIVFFTDREGGLYPKLYVMNADGTNQRPCDCSDLLVALKQQQVTAPDGHAFVFVRGPEDEPVVRRTDTQIWMHDNTSNTDSYLIGGPPSFDWVDYDPTWSPRGNEIVWVSQINKADEIYAFDLRTRKTERLIHSDWEWYKQPTFAPDGSQLAFMSNRETQRQQIWVMERDSGAMRNLSRSAFNDSAPLWVR